MSWIQDGVLAWVELEGAERLYFPPAGPGHRPWPLVGRRWRARLAQVRFRARQALDRLGIPGIFPGLDVVWVPRAWQPSLVNLQERLDARLARLRREMEESYEALREEALRRMQRLARRRIRAASEERRPDGEVLRVILGMAERAFPPPEFFRAYPRLVVAQAPVPAEWEGLIPVAGLRARAVEPFWEVFWEILLRTNGKAGRGGLHGRLLRRLEARLNRVPSRLLEGDPELGRLAAMARRTLRTSEGRRERLEAMRRLLEEMAGPPLPIPLT